MIREATIDDFPEVEMMARAFYEEGKFEELYGTKIDHDSLIAFIVSFISEEDKVILLEPGKGMIAGALIPFFFNNKKKLAQEMAWWVSPDFRQGMTGGRLLMRFEKWAEGKKADILVMGALSETSGESVGEIYNKRGMIPLETMYGKLMPWQ